MSTSRADNNLVAGFSTASISDNGSHGNASGENATLSKPQTDSDITVDQLDGGNTISPPADLDQQEVKDSTAARLISVRSNESFPARRAIPNIVSVVNSDDQDGPQSGSGLDLASGSKDTNDFLSRSSSVATSRSLKTMKSMKSVKSVNSLAAIGALPFGSLRLHEETTATSSNSPECLKSGDVILVTGMEGNILFGYDTIALSTGKSQSFHGIRDVPPGPHFVYAGAESAVTTRTGYWIMSSKKSSDQAGEVIVKRWDKENEELQEEVSLAEARFQAENVPEIFSSLLPYVARAASKAKDGKTKNTRWTPWSDNYDTVWQRMTSAIKGKMLTKITGHQWNRWRITSVDDSKLTTFSTPVALRPHESVEEIIKDQVGEHRVFTFFFSRNERTFSELVIGRARTEQALDTSSYVLEIAKGMDKNPDDDPANVVGELQFCYITGLLLGNFACMEQWAHVVKVLFKAYRLAMTEPLLVCSIIETLHAQFIYDDEAVADSIFDHDAKLRDDLKYLLTVYKSRLNEQLLAQGAELSHEQSKVGDSFEALEAWLWKWDWDLRGNYVRSGKYQLEDGELVDAEMRDFEAEDERGEYAPVVVDLDEQGQERGLLRW